MPKIQLSSEKLTPTDDGRIDIRIKGLWASIGPLSFCFIEVMDNEFWNFLSSILSFLTFEKLHAEIFGQHFNTTNQ